MLQNSASWLIAYLYLKERGNWEANSWICDKLSCLHYKDSFYFSLLFDLYAYHRQKSSGSLTILRPQVKAEPEKSVPAISPCCLIKLILM